jgi:hypothetical protein
MIIRKSRHNSSDIKISKNTRSTSKVEATSKKGAMWLLENTAEMKVEYVLASELVNELADVLNAEGLIVEIK